MNEMVRCMGVVKLFQKTTKHYQAVVIKGMNRTRLLKRKFRTYTQAEVYSVRFLQRWFELHREA